MLLLGTVRYPGDARLALENGRVDVEVLAQGKRQEALEDLRLGLAERVFVGSTTKVAFVKQVMLELCVLLPVHLYITNSVRRWLYLPVALTCTCLSCRCPWCSRSTSSCRSYTRGAHGYSPCLRTLSCRVQGSRGVGATVYNWVSVWDLQV